MKNLNSNDYHWFLLLFLAIFLAVLGIKSTGIVSMAFFLASITLLVAGIGRLERTLEEMATGEEESEAEEKEAKNEEGLRQEDARFRANEEQMIRQELAILSRRYREGALRKRKYSKEIDELKNEFEELKTGVELHLPGKKRRRRSAKAYNRVMPNA